MRAVVETLLEILEKADISSTVFSEPITNPEKFDLGLRALLVSGENEPYEPVLNRLRRLEQNTFYHLQDTFYTNYAIFLLPDEERPRWLSVGPMLITQPSGEQILSLLERLGLPGTLYHELAAYYERLPQLKSQEVF
jgi:hypothetical protein